MPVVPGVVPSVNPSGAALPEVNIPVSPDAFGAAAARGLGVAGQGLANLGQGYGEVGAALRSAGSDIDHGANELFAETMRLQDLQNRTEVDKADAQYMEQAGILHAKFSAKQGQEAVDAFPQYMQDLQTARGSIRDGLSNPMVQKMYDSQTLSTMGRTIFNGAGHAATQQRMAAIDAVQSRLETTVSQAATSDDPDTVTAAKEKAQGLNYQLHQLKGTPESAADGEFKINSSLDSNVIIHTARKDPWQAKQMLEDAQGKLTEQDYDRADNIVRSQIRSIGSVNLAQKVWDENKDEDGKPEVSLEQMQAAVRQHAEAEAPDDPIYAQHAVAAVNGLYNQNRRAEREFRWDNTQTVDAAIQNGVKNVQELRADPKVAAAIDALPPSEQNKIPERINRYNASASKVANEENYRRLQGLSNNDVETFLNTDLTHEQLNQSQIDKLQRVQTEIKKNQNADPRVNQAMTQLRGAIGIQLQSLGIYHRDSRSPDDYDHFTGALQQAIESWREGHGKPPEYKDIVQTIGPQLLKDQVTKSSFGSWFDSKDQFYKAPVPDQEAKAIKADLLKEKGIELTDEEVGRIYRAQQFEALYGKSATMPKATQPE